MLSSQSKQFSSIGFNQQLKAEESGPDRGSVNHRIKMVHVGVVHLANQITLFDVF